MAIMLLISKGRARQFAVSRSLVIFGSISGRYGRSGIILFVWITKVDSIVFTPSGLTDREVSVR
jgi:hypothetical protein